jgi:hypothetical protein
MMQHLRLKHQFVHYIPERLEPGVLYVSVDYTTAVHSCCCGCGQEVVTPLSPSGWKLIFDGETVSLSPSIGNRNFECRSHYFIERNTVIEAKPFTCRWSSEEEPAVDTKLEVGGNGATNGSEDSSAWSRLKGWVFNGKKLVKLHGKKSRKKRPHKPSQ